MMCKRTTFTIIQGFADLCFSRPYQWSPLFFSGKVHRTTTCVAISAYLFLVKMTQTLPGISPEVEHDILPCFLLLMPNRYLPSCLHREMSATLPMSHHSWRDRCVASSLWSYVMYTPEHCSSTQWLFEERRWRKWMISMICLLLSLLEVSAKIPKCNVSLPPSG